MLSSLLVFSSVDWNVDTEIYGSSRPVPELDFSSGADLILHAMGTLFQSTSIKSGLLITTEHTER
jgi:hypothetical protein